MSKTFVIFICAFDPFGRGLVRYTVTPYCREDGVEMVDGTNRLFINAPAHASCEDKRLACFLAYLCGGTIGDEFTQRVDDAVRLERDRPEWRLVRMRLDMKFRDNFVAGRKEGLQEGREEGLQEGREEGLQEGLQVGRQEGLQEGRNELARLAEAMRDAGRADELLQALTDPAMLDCLLDEFGITAREGA